MYSGDMGNTRVPHRSAVWLAVAIAACVSLGLYAQQQTRSLPPITYPPAPESFGSLLEAAEATVMLRLGDREYQDHGGPVTRFRAEVVEVFRRDAAINSIGATVDFYQPGGLHEDATGELVDERDDGYPPLSVGTTVVVVIRWHPGYEGWVSWFGPNGIFLLGLDGMVRSPGQAAATRSQVGRPVGEFLTDVRRITGF